MNSPKTTVPKVSTEKTANRPAVKKAKEPKMVTYIMKQNGRTTGVSGELYDHELFHFKENSKMVKQFRCTVPEGEFDHLFDDNGKSVHVLGKL